MTVVYKVVRVEEDRLYSICTSGEHRVEYSIDTVIRPKNGKLFVFETVEDANQFVYLFGFIGFQIWKAETDKVYEAPQLIPTSAHIAEASDFWYSPNYYLPFGSMLKPKGTVWCDWIKLLERIV